MSTGTAHTSFLFFFFNDTATTEIYTLSLHDALPISRRLETSPFRFRRREALRVRSLERRFDLGAPRSKRRSSDRSEEHTSELQSQSNLVCRLLLEKKKKEYSPRSGEHSLLHTVRPRA